MTEQTNERFDVVISDNLSNDGTQSLVSSLSDPRIRYFRTDKRLSMCDNFDFALQQVKSDYVLYIGDDDALMPECIDTLISLIEARPYPTYCWPQSFYTWGTNKRPPSVSYLAKPRQPRELILRGVVERAFRFGGARYMDLPLLYHSLVSTRLLDSIRSRTGRVFHSTNPDVFCGFAIPVFSEKALDVGRSMTLRGSSEGGYYDVSVSDPQVSEPAARMDQFLKEYGQYHVHHTLDQTLPHIVTSTADSMLLAADLFPEYYAGVTFNYEFWYAMVQRYWHFSAVSSIFADHSLLKARHSFNRWRFLMYAALYRGYGAFQVLKNVRRKNGSYGTLYEECPLDVYACANLIADSFYRVDRVVGRSR